MSVVYLEVPINTFKFINHSHSYSCERLCRALVCPEGGGGGSMMLDD